MRTKELELGSRKKTGSRIQIQGIEPVEKKRKYERTKERGQRRTKCWVIAEETRGSGVSNGGHDLGQNHHET